MTPQKITMEVRPKIRRLWAARLGMWLLNLAEVEVFADGKSLGRRKLFDVEVKR